MTPKELNKKEKYLVHDPFNGDYEPFETIEEAYSLFMNKLMNM